MYTSLGCDPKLSPFCKPVPVPPTGYQPPTTVATPAAYTPESNTGLYVGLGLGAVVIVGGLYLLFGRAD